MSFLETVNQGEGLINWLTEPPAVCWSVIMGDFSPGPNGVYCTRPKAKEQDHQAVLCKVCVDLVQTITLLRK